MSKRLKFYRSQNPNDPAYYIYKDDRPSPSGKLYEESPRNWRCVEMEERDLDAHLSELRQVIYTLNETGVIENDAPSMTEAIRILKLMQSKMMYQEPELIKFLARIEA